MDSEFNLKSAFSLLIFITVRRCFDQGCRYQFERRLHNVIAMHAREGLYISCEGKHGGQYKTNFMSLTQPFLTFQTLMLATLGKWATSYDRVFFLGQELLLHFAAWIDLTSNADNSLRLYQCSVRSYRAHFASLKRVDDLRVY